MALDTATTLEVIRTVVAVFGVVCSFAALLFTVRDWRVLHFEGINGPTGIVYAQKVVTGSVILASQAAYVVVGAASMLAPSPVPPEVAVALNLTSVGAVMSVQTYLNIAVQASILVTSMMLTASLWQLASRHALATALRNKALREADRAAAQAQADRMEAVGVDTNDMLRRGDIGRGQKAVVDRDQADRIEATGEETKERLQREGIGDGH